MGHFNLKASINGKEEVSESSLTISGNSFSFKVYPTDINNTENDIHGSVVLSHNNKNYSIALKHKSSNGDYPDPEPSVPKWSYVDDLCVSYNGWGDENPVRVSDDNAKDFQYGYIVIESGVYHNYDYDHSWDGGINDESIDIGFVFTTASVAEDAIRHICYDKVIRLDESYEKIFRFKMFYKLPTIDDMTGDIITPTDEDTPESHRLRLPCKVEFKVPYWLTNTFIVYRIRTIDINTSEVVDTDYTDWDLFRAAWEEKRLDTIHYSDAKFYGYLYSNISRNYSATDMRGPNTITIQEVAQDVNGTPKIFGAKPLYIYASQLEVRTPYNRQYRSYGE